MDDQVVTMDSCDLAHAIAARRLTEQVESIGRRRELLRNEVLAMVKKVLAMVKKCLIVASIRHRPVYKSCSVQTP